MGTPYLISWVWFWAFLLLLMTWRCCRRCASCSQVESLLHRKDKGQNFSILQKHNRNLLFCFCRIAGCMLFVQTPCKTFSVKVRLCNQKQHQHITIKEYYIFTTLLKVNRIKATFPRPRHLKQTTRPLISILQNQVPCSSLDGRRCYWSHPGLWDTALGLHAAPGFQETGIEAVLYILQQHSTAQLLHRPQRD